jgi:hypothetical protein
MIRHNGGELLLKEMIRGLLVSKDWYRVKKLMAQLLYELQKPSTKTGIPKLDNLQHSVRYLLYLDIVGPEIRELWGPEAEEAYKPELLREPYLTAAKRNDLTKLANKVLHAAIDELTQEDHQIQNKEESLIFDAKYKYFITTKMRAQSVIQRKFHKVAPRELREDLGDALSCILREEDVLVRLLATPLTPESSYDPRKFDNVDDMHYKFGGGAHAGMTAEEQGEVAVDDVLARFEPDMMNKLCLLLRGTVLSKSLRVDVWEYKYLSRLPSEAPNAAGASAVRELARISAEKGYDVSSSRGLERSKMSDAIISAVDHAISTALPVLSSNDNNSELSRPNSTYHNTRNISGNNSIGSGNNKVSNTSSNELTQLAARARILVHAVFALNDDFGSRSVLICVLLTWAFPTEPPTSEKMLRIYQRITYECLPSEQLHHEFSLATVAHNAWALLLERDPELARFLQNYKVKDTMMTVDKITHNDPLSNDVSNPESKSTSRPNSQGNGMEDDNDVNSEFTNTDGSIRDKADNNNDNPTLDEKESKENDNLETTNVPRSLLLLRGWLRDGFLGWVGGHTAIFLWDQLTLFDASPNNYKTMLPIFCCILLRAMRKPLMALPEGQNLLKAMNTNGRILRTKLIIEAIRREPLFKNLAPPKQQRPEHAGGTLVGSGSVKSLTMSRTGRSGSAGGGGTSGLYGNDALNAALDNKTPVNDRDSYMVHHNNVTPRTDLAADSGLISNGASAPASARK